MPRRSSRCVELRFAYDRKAGKGQRSRERKGLGGRERQGRRAEEEECEDGREGVGQVKRNIDQNSRKYVIREISIQRAGKFYLERFRPKVLKF